MSTKINQKFQNLPLELVRHIIGFARPQYEYMDELTWCNKYLQFDGEWNKANPGMFNWIFDGECSIRNKLLLLEIKKKRGIKRIGWIDERYQRNISFEKKYRYKYRHLDGNVHKND